MYLSDFIEQSDEVDSLDALLELMLSVARGFGFDKSAYCSLTAFDPREAHGNPPPVVVHNYPDSWLLRYVERKYQTIDPVLRFAPRYERAFLWDSLVERFSLKQEQIRVMDEIREAGLYDGITVPLHGPHGRFRLVSFAASEGHPKPSAFLRKLTSLAVQFHQVYRDIARNDSSRCIVPALTPRELECLQWAATGMSSPNIGNAMNISLATVTFHLGNILRKLEVTNRVQAIVVAIRYGLITLDRVPYEIESRSGLKNTSIARFLSFVDTP